MIEKGKLSNAEQCGSRTILFTIKGHTKFSYMSETEARSETTLSISGTGSHSLLCADT